MNSFLIDSFTGISDYDDKGIRGAFKGGSKNLNVRTLTDSLKCNQKLTAETLTGLSGLVKTFVPMSNGNMLAFCNDGKIFELSDGTWNLKYTDTNEAGNISGAAEWYEPGHTFIYWATPTRLNRKPYPGASDWSDINTTGTGSFPKTNLTDSIHTMAQVNGVLLITNKNNLAFVAYDSSYTNDALQLIPGNISKALAERNRYALIGCTALNSSAQSGMFVWDQISQSWNDKKIIPVNGVNAMIDTELPLMQVGTNGQLFYGDLTTLLPVTSFPGGGQVNPYGVANDDGVALFGVYGNGVGKSGIYSYGRKWKNAPFTLNLEYQIDCDEIGAIVKHGSDIYASIKDDDTYSVVKVDTSAKATAVYKSLDLKAPANALLQESLPNWAYVKVTCAPLPENTSIALSRRTDKSGSMITANLQSGASSFSTTNGMEAIFLVGDIGKIFEFDLTLTPNGNNTPEVYRIEVLFE